jgi:hypothetical protein
VDLRGVICKDVERTEQVQDHVQRWRLVDHEVLYPQC